MSEEAKIQIELTKNQIAVIFNALIYSSYFKGKESDIARELIHELQKYVSL